MSSHVVSGSLSERFERCFGGLAAIGRRPSGGWDRFAWTAEDRAARAWFATAAAERGLDLEQDGAGNLWAWWGKPSQGAIATGSHLDTVPAGGAFDGALGVVSSLLAVEELRRSGARPRRPIAVVAFADEEGARFNTPTFGSRVLTGALAPETVLERRDSEGIRLADALAGAGVDLGGIGPDPARLDRVAAFVELHVEQGRGLGSTGAAVGVATGIWPHGRWRLDLVGEANHAGTTLLEDRRDPTLALAETILAARRLALDADARTTVGRIAVDPNSSNSVPGAVTAWLDARAADDVTLDGLVEAVRAAADAAAARQRVTTTLTPESRAAGVQFDQMLSGVLSKVLAAQGVRPGALPTAAGHDAGALAGAVPSAMLFVRNPTGVSHGPAEFAEPGDCLAGVRALTAVLEQLACN